MKSKRKWLIPVFCILILLAAFLIYSGMYYHADMTALAALESDETVEVEKTEYGWFFDGPSEEDVLVFYPGAKVEETAYAPLLHRLAGKGMDVCLVKMPFRFAFFAVGKAGRIPAADDYASRYIGGHSLGGAMAAWYAAGHDEKYDGVILLGAYPTKALADHLQLLSIYGSEDGILNRKKVTDGRKYAPKNYEEYVIDGGNHAYFGSYGEQKGDGEASLSAEEQQELTVDFILEHIR